MGFDQKLKDLLRLQTTQRNRGKTPGKRKLLIQWAKARSRILSTARLCWHQSRVCRLGKTRFRSSSCFCFGVSRLSTSILPTTGKRAHNLPRISKRCHPLRVPGFLPLLQRAFAQGRGRHGGASEYSLHYPLAEAP